MPATWPDDAAVEAYLTALGVIESSWGINLTTLCAGKAESARRKFETATGWLPFLAGAGVSTRYFDPPGERSNSAHAGWTWLGGDRLMFSKAGIATATGLVVTVGVSPTDAGTALTINEQFWLEPLQAAEEGRPYTEIRFGWPQRGNPRSIKVDARWGWGTTVPQDIWDAVRSGALADALTDFAEVVRAAPVEWKDGDVSERQSIEAIQKLGESALKKFDGVIRDYRQVMA